jgi:hypothetical protein
MTPNARSANSTAVGSALTKRLSGPLECADASVPVDPREPADRRGQQHRGRRRRSRDQMTTRAEHRVGSQRHQQRVQPGLRRKPRQPGVRDRTDPTPSRPRSRQTATTRDRTSAATPGSARTAGCPTASAPPKSAGRPEACRSLRFHLNEQGLAHGLIPGASPVWDDSATLGTMAMGPRVGVARWCRGALSGRVVSALAG